MSTKLRPSAKYNELFCVLHEQFLKARSQGRRVDFNWLWSKARIIYREQQNDPEVVVKKHVVATFIKRNSLRLCRTQRNKKFKKEQYRDPMMKWHSTLREPLVKTDMHDMLSVLFTPENWMSANSRWI